MRRYRYHTFWVSKSFALGAAGTVLMVGNNSTNGPYGTGTGTRRRKSAPVQNRYRYVYVLVPRYQYLVGDEMSLEVVGLDECLLADGAGVVLLQGVGRLNVLHQV